mmetsp:Transcript_5401/g.13886  ORF Transcript_5401/g.13886 Transcript_5401/m.13886 type:complete len:84 (+) Transcript_5401:207-458(+)
MRKSLHTCISGPFLGQTGPTLTYTLLHSKERFCLLVALCKIGTGCIHELLLTGAWLCLLEQSRARQYGSLATLAVESIDLLQV